MRTLHSQKLFFQPFINISCCCTTIRSQSVSLLFCFLSIPLTTQQKERRQSRINQPNFPPGLPSALLPSVPAAAARQLLEDNTARVAHQAPAPRACCCDCHSPVLLPSAFTRTSWGQLPLTSTGGRRPSSQHYRRPSPRENQRPTPPVHTV